MTRAPVNVQIPALSPHRMEDTVKTAIAETKTSRAPNRSATHPLIGMKTASISKYAVIPMFRSTGFAWNDLPMSGSAVAMTVPSRFSIKNAVATKMEIVLGFGVKDGIISVGPCKFHGRSLCRFARAKFQARAAEPPLRKFYFAWATSGRGMASTGNDIWYGW